MRTVLVFICVSIALLATLSTAYSSPKHTVHLFNNESFQEEKAIFSPYDKIYAVIDFSNLVAGEYELSAEWILPSGKLLKQDTYTLALSQPRQSSRVHFWLKLRPKGTTKRLFSKRKFSKAIYGQWKIQLYCNKEALPPVTFEIADILP